jgi:hypothetical protein
MSASPVIQKAMNQFGRRAGLEKKSGAWYRRTDDLIAISKLQKSQYGPQYYVNQGFWLRQLGDERYPKESRWHITIRLETLAPDERDRIGRLLDLEHEMPDEQRVEELVALLEERLLPVIERGGSLAGLRRMIEDGTLAGAAIRGPAQQALAVIK